ncbi:AMP-binding protein [Colwellia sp. Bg11-12]|jgi:long-chain acyl-CoA synthetase|uniref:AMP-binding protein n=1 Tax=Colwellia sp. Bg11-12 TaxID=2759817 RepID=UPI0015F7253D|nr:AMP-binding protein [Colwellia sp. Bg11-12]MBA6263561.1 AMP-binding protein [Colwellia sp. Bg11-12]
MEKLFQVLRARADLFPHQPALISDLGDQQIITTNQQLVQKIAAVEAAFKAQNLACVGLFMDNCSEWIICDLAAAKLGITLVPIPLFFTATQIGHLVKSAHVDAIITKRNLMMALGTNKHLNFTTESELTLLPLADTVLLPLSQEQRSNSKVDVVNNMSGITKVTYTSGSTGEPKGVCLSSANIAAVCEGIEASMVEMGIADHLCVMPLATLLENIAGVYIGLLRGGAIITAPLAMLGFVSNVEFDIEKLVNKIAQHQVGSVILLPQILKHLVHALNKEILAKCASLTFIALGGGKSSPHILQQAIDSGLPVYEGYGLSECCSVVSLNLPKQHKVGSVGKVLPHARVSIAQDGEIIIDGQAMLGYLGELDQVAKQIHTGDLGYIDADGFIYVSGRKKNTIVSSFGRNISPEWVEASLTSSSVISQVAVFGEARPALSAIVVTRDKNDLAVQQAIDAVNKSLPDYAQIHHWLIADAPFSVQNHTLTSNGRLKRKNIELMYEDKLAALYC